MNLEEIKERYAIEKGYGPLISPVDEDIEWLIDEVERLRERLPPTDAPWTLKELRDAKADREKLIGALETIQSKWHCDVGMNNQNCTLFNSSDPKEWCGWCYCNAVLAEVEGQR